MRVYIPASRFSILLVVPLLTPNWSVQAKEKLPEPPATDTCKFPSEQFATLELSTAFVTVKSAVSMSVIGFEVINNVLHKLSVTVKV